MWLVNLPPRALVFITIFSTACSNQPGQQPVGKRASEVQVASSHPVRERETGTDTFTIGSSNDAVRLAMGQPDNVRTKSGGEIEIWNYRFSTVAFRGGKVTGWEDHSNVLKSRGSGDTRLAESDEKAHGGQSDSVSVSPELAARMGARTTPPPSGATNPSVQYVEGHQRSNGSAVQGYYRTTGDASRTNNFSSSGNVNPFTRKRGSR